MSKVTYIMPAVGKKPGEKYIGSWKMEPMTIATLAALTPSDWETEFFDDRLELIDYDTETDLVAITVETYTALRAYRIAEKFRKRGIPVVMGGYHPTHLPEEASRFADSVVIGNAEGVMDSFFEDLTRGTLKKVYKGPHGYSVAIPDRSIYGGKEYLGFGLVETGRGCKHSCEFCSITAYYGATYHPRPIKDVVADIKASGQKFFFLIDDNFIANPGYAIDLCREISKLNIYWFGQASINVARNEELLYWLKKSGCMLLLIGFESLDERNLMQMNKTWNADESERDTLIKKIHSAGIGIYATFVFGFDNDTSESIEKTVDFSLRHKFFFAAFNHLLPFPETPVYRQFKSEGRFETDQWWLDSNFTYGDIPFRPKKMDREELSHRCYEARMEFYRARSIMKRGIALLGRRPALALLPIFFSSNRLLGSDVTGRDSLPLGKGLDELPK